MNAARRDNIDRVFGDWSGLREFREKTAKDRENIMRSRSAMEKRTGDEEEQQGELC